jgi:hypothetical protein
MPGERCDWPGGRILCQARGVIGQQEGISHYAKGVIGREGKCCVRHRAQLVGRGVFAQTFVCISDLRICLNVCLF